MKVGLVGGLKVSRICKQTEIGASKGDKQLYILPLGPSISQPRA